jgi:hypothetical protein
MFRIPREFLDVRGIENTHLGQVQLRSIQLPPVWNIKGGSMLRDTSESESGIPHSRQSMKSSAASLRDICSRESKVEAS